MARLKNPDDPYASKEDYQEMVRRKRPTTPSCCGSSVESGAIRLALDEQGKPYWAVLGWNDSFHSLTELYRVRACCPFCAAPLPEIVLCQPPPSPLCVDDGDGYCLTCKERLMGCLCHCVTHRWCGKPKE